MEPGKVVCVGRNYAEHARELGNPVIERPLLFMKPNTALVPLEEPLALPQYGGICHHEIELAALVGEKLSRADSSAAAEAVIGYAVALDLTLRDLQKELQKKGHPWELSKAFDGSCPISPLVKKGELDAGNATLKLSVNDQVRQQGNTRSMLMGVFDLISYISQHFTLLPGDLILTGTPAGVGALNPGDKLFLELDGRFHFSTSVL